MKQQSKDSRYYTPDVEDLRIGYECEACFTSYGGYMIWNEDETIEHHEPEDKEAAKNWSNYCIEVQLGTWNDNSQRSMQTAINILKDGRLRTPYLTQQQIEELGWEHTGGQLLSHGRQDYEKGNYVLNHWCYSPPRELSMVRIYIKENPMVMGNYNGIDKILYDGTCKSINELRTIQKLLKIQ